MLERNLWPKVFLGLLLVVIGTHVIAFIATGNWDMLKAINPFKFLF